jgi:hypothetical protein
MDTILADTTGRFKMTSPDAYDLPAKLTFTDEVEEVTDHDSGRSRMAPIDRNDVRAERQNPIAAYWRCPP